ncbi:MAG: alpha/beta hydrolase [Rhodospirillaceae bacterium]|nr:alpha/beta hydrolase [Rhodospirillaceae bacterium]
MITYFVSFREQPRAGSVSTGQFVSFDDAGGGDSPKLKVVDWDKAASLVAGRTVIFAAHGFNVNQGEGVRSLARLHAHLRLDPAHVFIGVLWPGDFWIPVINYPTESADANRCGQHLAAVCQRHFASAAEFVFFSHSLGARVVLTAAARLHTAAKILCLTASAVDRDCLLNEFQAARDNAASIRVLASRRDIVLKLAYPAGDLVADVLDKDDAFFKGALGRKGPAKPADSRVTGPWQIPDKESDGGDYGHGDYLPGSKKSQFGNPVEPKPVEVAAYLSRALAGQPQPWPRQ